MGSFRERDLRAPILYDFKVEDLDRKMIPDSIHFASLCWMEDELQQALPRGMRVAKIGMDDISTKAAWTNLRKYP